MYPHYIKIYAMKQSVYAILILICIAINVSAQDSEIQSVIADIATNSRILDAAYLTEVAKKNPQLIKKWHVQLNDAWELRKHPATKPISNSYQVLEERIWSASSVLDLELTHVISRDDEKEVVYRIGETSTFLILKSTQFLNQSVNKSRTLSSLTQKSEALR